MQLHKLEDPPALGHAAAARAAACIREAVAARGRANIILATGASQFSMLENLVEETVDWSKVRMFHLDEYIGLKADHPASFRRYLQERFVNRVPALEVVHFIRGDVIEPQVECERLNGLIRDYPIDVAMIGIGENGHLAFNDPPADFGTEEPFIIVELDEACRRQQLGEGWFPNLEAVPKRAISMSIRHIMKSEHLIVSVPDARKADAVHCAVKEPVTPECPASILQQHPQCDLFLDKNSAARL